MTGQDYVNNKALHPFWDASRDQNKEDVADAYEQGKADGWKECEKQKQDTPEGLEEAAIDFADNARKQLFTKDYAISSIADYDHGCIDGFKAGAKWMAEQVKTGDLAKKCKHFKKK